MFIIPVSFHFVCIISVRKFFGELLIFSKELSLTEIIQTKWKDTGIINKKFLPVQNGVVAQIFHFYVIRKYY